ncbi:MAG TPA: ATP-binding protein [Pseudolysinimonas sp.]|jgi:signal transduction histidine kinase
MARVESAIARSTAGVGVVFFAQSLPTLLGDFGKTEALWSLLSVAFIVAGLLFTVLASIARRLVRVSMVTFGVLFLGVLVSWPFAVQHPSPDSPWIYFLITVATAMAAVGLSVSWAAAYLVLIPLVYAIIRLTPAGGGLTPLKVSLDSIYALILGGAILVIITMLRAAATAVDAAQATALEGYAHAVRAHAMEAERVRVDAIVHDSVLTTLLYAARADTPEARRLAVTMASNAVGHLRDAALASPDDGSAVRVSAVALTTRAAVEELEGGFEVTATRLGTRSIPAAAAEAVRAAALQAAVNSVNHAGDGVTRTMRMTAYHAGIQIVVADDGRGFDPSQVASERLGLRVSIQERVANVGGTAEVESAPGAGTTVVIRWPADGPHAASHDAGLSEAADLADQEVLS